MDTQHLIGYLLPEGVRRDAVHIAVLPVVAAEDCLEPGSRVKLLAGTTDQAVSVRRYNDPGMGVVDPFLGDTTVRKGDWFFLFLNPRTVTNLRHHWELPALDSPVPLSEAETWLRRFTDRYGMNYNAVLASAQVKDSYILADGRDLHGAEELEPGELERFWECVESVTGNTYNAEHKGSVIWTCTCRGETE